MDHTINDLVNRALQAWIDLTGVDVEGRSWTRARNCPWHDVTSVTKDVSESRELDPTGVTAFMLLRGLLEEYLRDLKVPCYDLILKPKSVEDVLTPMRELRDLLESPQVVEVIEDFQSLIQKAALQYGVKGTCLKQLDTLLADKATLAYVRRDALRSIQTLEAHQFVQGKTDPVPLKFNPDVHEFWNVNSLLEAMRAQRVPGITLCLIRDPEDVLFSYFVFAIKNGENFTILTDKEYEAHPDFRRMTRSRAKAREFERRTERHRFPYELLELEATPDGKELYAKARTALVPMNAKAVALRPIRELTADEFVWLVLMFDLIRERYWKDAVKLPELSYTGQMVVEPAALVGPQGSLVRDGTYKPLELAPVCSKDLTPKNLKPQWEHKPVGHNHWMIDRYADKVPEEVLNPVGDNAAKQLVENAQSLGVPVERDYMGSEKALKVRTLQPTMFGTRETIERDRLWIARRNQTTVVQRLAEAEFEREKDTTIAWFVDAIRLRREFLLNAAARGELVLPSVDRYSGFRYGLDAKDRNVAKRHYERHSALWGIEGKFSLSEWDRTKGYWTCSERPEIIATVVTDLLPTCPEALAALLGFQMVESLPWPLQHWCPIEPYTGNEILDRLDPEDWALDNPWNKIRFGVRVPQCRRAIQARRKALGLPPDEFKGSSER